MQKIIDSNVFREKAANLVYDKFCKELIFLFNSLSKTFVVCNKIYVAVSGGADSIALLHLLKKFLDENRFADWCASEAKIICLTVDHNLRVESKKDVEFVEKICESIGVDCYSLVWDKKNSECIKKNKLENLARDARYNLFEKFLKNANDTVSKKEHTVILTGHNLSDQIETFFMRKNMGSSNAGLACMSRIRTLNNNLKIIRPLLKFYKQDLEDYLSFQKISWVHDCMNDDEGFKRILYRKNYNTHQKTAVNDDVAKIINEHAKTRSSIEERAVSLLCTNSVVEICNNFGFAKILHNKFVELLNVDEAVAAEFISRIFWTVGGKKYKCNVTFNILESIKNKKNLTLACCIVTFKKEFIYIIRENRNIPIINTTTPCDVMFDNRFRIIVKKNIGEICIKSAHTNHYLNRNVLKKIFCSFPYIYKNNIVVECGNEILEYQFINKVGLFDIFI